MRLALPVTTAQGINRIRGCTNVPLGWSRSSSQSGNVLCHCACLLLGSQLQAELCKQPLDLPVVQPQEFGKSMENPAWCSQNPVVKPWLFANPAHGAVPTPLGASSNGLGAESAMDTAGV